MGSSQIDETAVINGCIKGDRKCQKMLYEHNYENLLGLSLRYLSDANRANSMVNESFLKIFEKIKSYDGNGSIVGWMRTIVRNTIIDHLRREKKLVYTDEIGLLSMGQSEENKFIDQINEEEVQRILQKLKEDERVIFNLFVLEEFSHKEITKMLGLKEGRSRALLHQSKKRLRKLLGNRRLTSVLVG